MISKHKRKYLERCAIYMEWNREYLPTTSQVKLWLNKAFDRRAQHYISQESVSKREKVC